MNAARDKLDQALDDPVIGTVLDLTVYDPPAPTTDELVAFLRTRGGTLGQRTMQAHAAQRLEAQR